MLKRGIIILTAVLFLLPGGTLAYGGPEHSGFSDMEGSFAEEPVDRLAAMGIIEGISPGEFAPGKSITRGQFAVWMARTLGIQPVLPVAPAFTDISGDLMQTWYIEALSKMGIIRGSGAEGFKPESPLLRQDAAVLVHQALGGEYRSPSINQRYTDNHSIAPYAAGSVAYVTGRGWMGGSDNRFYPLNEMTRAEAACLMAHLLTARRGQALTAFPVVSPMEIYVKTGEDRQIEPRSARHSPPFTPVYGVDDPGICTVSPDGVITGVQPGEGTVTVNGGYNAYTISTRVSASKTLTDAARSVINEVYAEAPETEYDFTYTISQHAPDTAFQQTERAGNPGPAGGLTDESGTWTGFLRQQGRDIVVDLKTVRTVTRISMEFSQNPEWGVWLPNHMKCEVSPDGAAWYHLGYANHGVSLSARETRDVNLTLTFSPVAARYVRISFPVDIWVFARHLSVAGRPAGTEPAVLAPAGLSGDDPGNYLQIPGINDILLIYTGNQSDYQNITVADFMPLVAYQNHEGVIGGRMFDTMLFLPYYGIPSTRESWSAYTEDLFAPGRQLQALDEAVARVNRYSGMQVREKVILSVPYPDPQQRDFGPIAEGGDSLCFAEQPAGARKAAADRFAAVQWYYNNLMANWKRAGFKHLDLAGIYWYGESIEKNSGEKDLVIDVARLVRNNHQEFFWIPYFGTKGYENWRSYGFSHVFLQPNYFAMNSPPEDRMDKAAAAARKYRMGIEIELEENVLYDNKYYQLFYSQLNKAHQLGFDGAMTNAYYAGSVKKTLVKSARSSDPGIRKIYDDLYRWISGTYE